MYIFMSENAKNVVCLTMNIIAAIHVVVIACGVNRATSVAPSWMDNHTDKGVLLLKIQIKPPLPL